LLINHGFSAGEPDAKFGPRTKQKVMEFQRAKGLGADGVVGPQTWAALGAPAPTSGVADGTAHINNQPPGLGLTSGSITVKGRTYQFNSGSSRLFSVPHGTYRVRKHRNERSDAGFVRDGVGFSFLIEDARRPGSDAMFDARAGRDRTLLRIHPDGGGTGTAGCIGLSGNGATLRQFRDDMNAEIDRHGGSYTLRVQ
ncbi:MAG TPA: peptidoglycan-binding domain-containing protein, partial [Myxococcaceae bacterium]